MKGIARLAALGALALLLAAPLHAQDWKGKGRIHGKVVHPDGKPYKGAKVSLHPAGKPGNGPEPFYSKKNGQWSYLGLKGGKWTVLIETGEYLLSEGTVDVNEFATGPGAPLVVTLRAPSPEQLQNEAADLVDEGNQLLKAGSYGEARARYEEALPEIAEENRPALMRGIAQTYIQEGQIDKALELLEQTFELVPDDPNSLKLIISVLLAEGRDDEAKAYIARLPEDAKLDTATRLNLGIELYNQGEFDGALEHFNKAIADYPDDAEGYYYRGLTYLGQQRNAQAAADFQKFLELAPDSPKAAEAQEFLEYLESQ